MSHHPYIVLFVTASFVEPHQLDNTEETNFSHDFFPVLHPVVFFPSQTMSVKNMADGNANFHFMAYISPRYKLEF